MGLEAMIAHTTPVFFRGRVQGAASKGHPGHFAAHNDLPGEGKDDESRELEKTLYFFQRNVYYPRQLLV
jgi:hypothetical protein